MSDRPRDHWVNLAKSWDLRKSPLRPAPEDIRIVENEVRRWYTSVQPGQIAAAVLGATPELARMSWPRAPRLLAIDKSQAMLRGVWPGAALGCGTVCAEWTALPLADASLDLILGDGCFSAVTGDKYRPFSRAMRRVIRGTGRVFMRYFLRPERSEPVSGIVADLWAGRIGNVHSFKWRLSMALHGTLAEGVRLDRIWDAWHEAVPEPERLAKNLDWPLPEILTMDDFRGVAARYTFPTLAEARAAVSGEFEEIACHYPSYELGERCPTLVLRPRGVGG